MAEGPARIREVAELPEVFVPSRRQPVGVWAYVVTGICVVAAIYTLYWAFFHPFFALEHRAIILLFMSSLVFLLYPLWKGKSLKPSPGISDIILWLTFAGILVWILIFADQILKRAGIFTTTDVIVGGIVIILVLEAARRSSGPIVPILALLFLGYSLLGPQLPGLFAHTAIDIRRLTTYLALSTDGIFGIPLGVLASFIFLFILYGAVLQRSGGGKFLTDIAFAMTQGTTGGPAKAAVVASTFMGSISGSSVANTTTTGTITIPLMKRAGFPAHFAGAVEASASTMGQIMPPVMGAAAFIMAEFLSIPYIMVAAAALIPASLAFFAVFMQVHYKAVLMGLKPEPGEERRSVIIKRTFASGWHHLISVAVLVGFLALQYSPERAVAFAIITQVIVSSLRKHTRMSPRSMVDACVDGATGTVEVAAICAVVGLIIGPITLTGLGLNFSAWIGDIARGSLLIGLPMAMLASLLLGMGVPTTAQYIIISALVAPALVQMGVLAIAAHLFILYFGTRADITPPVALAAYAGAGIAKSNPMKTGVTAFQLGLAGYIIPFMFVFNTGLILKGSPLDIVLAIFVAIVSIMSLASAVQGCLFIRTNLLERLLLFVIPIVGIFPIGMPTLIILPLSGGVLASQWLRRSRLSQAETLSTE